MSRDIHVDPSKQSKRWVSYLDLLGFTDLIRSKDWVYIFSYYTRAIESCRAERGFGPVEKSWFSDTFLLYSHGDSAQSFGAIEATTRWFVYFLITAGIPVRGAMSCADFYADKQNNVFFGKALVEAYHYGENQDWIGFVLTPSCVEQMAMIGLPANQRLNYAYWKIPYKKAYENLPEVLPACILGGSITINGKRRNACLDKLRETKERLKGNGNEVKYENTIQFIEANRREMEEG
jgi:hypothetical protein